MHDACTIKLPKRSPPTHTRTQPPALDGSQLARLRGLDVDVTKQHLHLHAFVPADVLVPSLVHGVHNAPFKGLRQAGGGMMGAATTSCSLRSAAPGM